MTLLLLFFLFGIGTIFGSFGSVLLTRRGSCTSWSEVRKQAKAILLGRSFCPQCKTPLKRYNLIPLVSFLLQKGKCTYCYKPIPKFYPLLEILSGLVFIGSFLGQHIVSQQELSILLYDPSARVQTLFHRCLLLLLVWDVLKYELHMPLRVLATMTGILYVSIMKQGGKEYFLVAGKYVLFLTTIFATIYLGAKYYVKYKYSANKKILQHTRENIQEGFGMGDVYVAGTVSIFFPLIHVRQKIPLTTLTASMIVCLFITLSAVIGIAWYFLTTLSTKIRNTTRVKKQKTTHQLPFLPPMILAFWVLLFGGASVWEIVFGSVW